MPRKTRKELTDIDEEEAGKQRREAYRRLESELHRVWHTQRSAGAHTGTVGYRSVLLKEKILLTIQKNSEHSKSGPYVHRNNAS